MSLGRTCGVTVVQADASGRIDWKALAQPDRLRSDLRFDLGIARWTIRREPVEDLGDHAADLAKLRDAEAARRSDRSAEAHTGGHGRLFRIERNTVLVAGDMFAARLFSAKSPVSAVALTDRSLATLALCCAVTAVGKSKPNRTRPAAKTAAYLVEHSTMMWR